MTDKKSDTGKFYTNYSFEYPKKNVVVATSSFQEVPSNKKPLINLTMNGILRPSEEKVHEIKMKFEGDVPQKDILATSYGTFVLCKGVYNSTRIMKTLWDKEKNTLTIIIDLRREKIRPRRPAQFSFSVQIDDGDCQPDFVKEGVAGQSGWKKQCYSGKKFSCYDGQISSKAWWVTKVGQAFMVSDMNMKLTREGSRCNMDMNKCKCNKTKSANEILNLVCNHCKNNAYVS